MNFYFRIACFISAALFAFTSIAQDKSGINISDAKIRHIPENMKVTAAYLSIHNHSDQDQVLVSLKSPAAKKVEVHETRIEDGMMRMVHLPELTIPAHGSVTLKQGGLHIMFMGLKRSLKVGEKIPVVLAFKNGAQASFKIAVADMRGSKSHHDHHMSKPAEHEGHGSHSSSGGSHKSHESHSSHEPGNKASHGHSNHSH